MILLAIFFSNLMEKDQSKSFAWGLTSTKMQTQGTTCLATKPRKPSAALCNPREAKGIPKCIKGSSELSLCSLFPAAFMRRETSRWKSPFHGISKVPMQTASTAFLV